MRPRKTPQRTCIACQTEAGKRELIRIVRTPEGNLEYDPTGKRSGRGAYLCGQPECLKQAVRQKRFERALGMHLPGELIEQLETLMKS
ncbi:MAG: YlxR family protein [Armatimonadetes bacterium]|nr:YlxR family protein [Armatimonadota bacterium]